MDADCVPMNREKQGRQAHENKCASEWTGKWFPSVGPFRRTLVGIAYQQTTLCISPVVPATMREIQNVVCLNAFPFVPPKPHSRQPSLGDALLGVANREVSKRKSLPEDFQAGIRFAFFLPIRCRFILCGSSTEYEMAEKDSTNDEAVSHEETGGTWEATVKKEIT